MEPQTDQAKAEFTGIIRWSVAILAVIIAGGLFLWSEAGVAVYFDRTANWIASCF